jgi:hypothetical protein
MRRDRTVEERRRDLPGEFYLLSGNVVEGVCEEDKESGMSDETRKRRR